MKSSTLYLCFAIISIKHNKAAVDITGINCVSLDKPFTEIEYCNLKVVNQTYKYMQVKANLLKVPINNVTVSISLMKNMNGYKPFLYNITFDACKFLKKSRRKSIMSYFYNYIKDHSNMNHSCPYNHDLIVRELDTNFVNRGISKLLPLPDGEYALYTIWKAYNKPRGAVNIYYRRKF